MMDALLGSDKKIVYGGSPAGIAAEKARHAIGREQSRPRADAHGEYGTVGERSDEYVVNPRDALYPFDARAVYRGAREGRQQRRRKVELCKLQFGERLAI